MKKPSPPKGEEREELREVKPPSAPPLDDVMERIQTAKEIAGGVNVGPASMVVALVGEAIVLQLRRMK